MKGYFGAVLFICNLKRETKRFLIGENFGAVSFICNLKQECLLVALQ